MKGIPALLVPMDLAEKRIFDQAKVIVKSIDRLKHLYDNFQTHKGFGIIKSIRRKHALVSMEYIKEIVEEGQRYKEYYQLTLERKDSGSLAKMGYVYIVKLEGLKFHAVNAFCYEPFTNQYRSRIGLKSYEWMLDGLIVPELRSLGK